MVGRSAAGLCTEPSEQLGSGVAVVDQASHMIGGAAQRFHHRHPSQRVAADVEHERVPVGGDDVERPLLRGTGRGSRPGWWSAGRSSPLATVVGGDRSVCSPTRSARHLLGAQVVVLQVERLEPGVARPQPVPVGEPLDERAAWPPSRPVGDAVGIALEPGRAPPPSGAARRRRRPRRRTRGRGTARTCGPARGCSTGSRARSPGVPSRSSTGALQRGVVADLADGADGVGEHEVVAQHVVLDHRQHDRGGADLQEGGDLAHVGVADDDVQAAVLLRRRSAARRGC